MSKRNAVLSMIGRIVDILSAPLTGVAALWLRAVRRVGFGRLPFNRQMLQSIGVIPIRNHYYEPFVSRKNLLHPLENDRELSGIDLNVGGQLELLKRFCYRHELLRFPREKTALTEFYYNNGMFESGDAEFLYSIIRVFRPRRIVEIGSGFSTLMARNAIRQNSQDDAKYACEHTCVEPYEQPWLETTGARIIRQRVEELDLGLFESLQGGDILFIDSSHVVRPQGDVLLEYLNILPRLRSGVFVHVHDIFTPRDYPSKWILDEMRLWHEQYLLEAFLSLNKEFRIIGALNYLKHHYPSELCSACPVLEAELSSREPGSFWFVRN